MDVDGVDVEGIWWRQFPHGGDPLFRADPPSDGRWQCGEIVGGLYFAQDEETAWAEWYRVLAEFAIPPERQRNAATTADNLPPSACATNRHDHVAARSRVADPPTRISGPFGQEIVNDAVNNCEQQVKVGVHRGPPEGRRWVVSTADFDLRCYVSFKATTPPSAVALLIYAAELVVMRRPASALASARAGMWPGAGGHGYCRLQARAELRGPRVKRQGEFCLFVKPEAATLVTPCRSSPGSGRDPGAGSPPARQLL